MREKARLREISDRHARAAADAAHRAAWADALRDAAHQAARRPKPPAA
jgi:hypothetical protein